MKYSLKRLLPIVLFLIIIWGLFVSHLLRTIQYDEAFTYINYAHSPITALFVYTAPNNHLLHSLLVWLSTTFIGDSLIAIRLPALLSGLLTVALLYRIGKQLFNMQSGLLASSFLIVMPIFGEYFVNARGYTLTTLLSVVFFWMTCVLPLYKLLSRNYERSLFLLTILMILTLPTMVILIPPIMFFLLLSRKKYFWESYFLPVTFGTGTGMLFYIHALILGNLTTFSSQFGYENPFELWSGFLQSLGAGWFIGLIAIGLLLSLRFLSVSKRNIIVLPIAITVITAIILSFLQYWLTDSVLFPRNYVYLLPFIALVSAAGWVSFIKHSLSIQSAPYALIVGLLVFASIQYQSLDKMSQVDVLDQTLQEYASEQDKFVIGCCLDFPIYYQYRNQQSFTDENPSERLVIIPTNYDDIDTLWERYGLSDDLVCSQTTWAQYEVFICPLINK